MSKAQGWLLVTVAGVLIVGAFFFGQASGQPAQPQLSASVNQIVAQPALVTPDVQALQPTPSKKVTSPTVASCVAQANANYPVSWANACYNTYNDLQRFLENCQLPQTVENNIDQERLDAIQACYSQE
jgi:hypothetical protein